MNKKLFSAVLMGALLFGGTFVSCKDYDDDIENLQNQINKLASSSELSSQVSTLQSAISAAQGAAEAKAAAAQTVADAAKGAANDAASAAKAAQEAADKVAADLDAANKDLAGKIEAAQAAADKASQNLEAALDAAKGEITKTVEAAQAAADKAAADLAALQASVEANTAAIEAAAKAAKAAQAAADAKASSEDVAAAAQKAADDLKAAKEELEGKLSALEAELNAVKESLKNTTTSDSLEAANEAIKKIEDSLNALMNVVGKRLTSLVYAPSTYINGIEAIRFSNLYYYDWSNDPANWLSDELPKYQASNGNWNLYYKEVDDYGTDVQYLVSPTGVTMNGIKELKFRYMENVQNTRAEELALEIFGEPYIEGGKLFLSLKKNDKSVPSASYLTYYTSKTEKVLYDTVQIGNFEDLQAWIALGDNKPKNDGYQYMYNKEQKTWGYVYFAPIDTVWTNETYPTWSYNPETMDIVALEAVLADGVKSEAEKEQEISVFSDWARVAEYWEMPRIHSAQKNAPATHFWNYGSFYSNNKADWRIVPNTGVGPNAIYQFDNDSYGVAVKQVYNQPLDLMDLVTVCTTENETIIKNYKKYGFEFEFHLIDYKVLNENATATHLNDATNQKLFAELNGSILTSTSEDGQALNKNAIGRTPVIQVVLKDTKNDAVVDVRYFKVKWIAETEETFVWDKVFEKTIGYECNNNYDDLYILEDYMNGIYAKIGENGMSKTEFWSTYSIVNSAVYEGPIDTEKFEAAVTAGISPSNVFTRIGYASKHSDNWESSQTQNVVVRYNNINWNGYDANGNTIPAKDTNFSHEGFFVFKASNSESYIYVPVKVNVVAGIYYFQYAPEQWNTGENTVTGTSGDAANKLRTINPVLYSDPNKGTANGFTTAQLIGDITLGYRYDGAAPTSVADMARYKYAEGTEQAALVKAGVITNPTNVVSSIAFDDSRLGDLPKLTKDNDCVGVTDGHAKADHKDFIWFVYKKTVDGETVQVLAFGKPEKDNGKIIGKAKGTDGAIIKGNDIYLVDTYANSQTLGQQDEPTEAALLLVGQKVPVKVNANHCDEITADKYYFDFIKPLVFKETGNTIKLRDIMNEGDSAVVKLDDYVNLAENFGYNHNRIYLFEVPSSYTTKNTTLKNWYKVVEPNQGSNWFSIEKALCNLDKNSTSYLTSCTTPLKEIIGRDGANQAYNVTISQSVKIEKQYLYNADGTPQTDELGNHKYNEVQVPGYYAVKFHNTNGNAIAQGQTLKIDIPVTVNTKWQKPLTGYIHVEIVSGL